jgi:hypothetical protein
MKFLEFFMQFLASQGCKDHKTVSQIARKQREKRNPAKTQAQAQH